MDIGIKDGAVIISIITVIFLGWLFVRVDHVETMTVRSKEWYRTIYELEDYHTIECHTRTSTDSNGKSTSRTSCDNVRHTRTINSWPLQGAYPTKPEWQADYTIGPNHYERRSESYVIRLSDDKEIWTYSVGDEARYNTFPVRGNCLVGINWFNVILKVEC